MKSTFNPCNMSLHSYSSEERRSSFYFLIKFERVRSVVTLTEGVAMSLISEKKKNLNPAGNLQ